MPVLSVVEVGGSDGSPVENDPVRKTRMFKVHADPGTPAVEAVMDVGIPRNGDVYGEFYPDYRAIGLNASPGKDPGVFDVEVVYEKAVA